MESSGFQGLLLASYSIAPQGGREDVIEDQSLAQAGIKAPLASPQGQSRRALPAASLGRNGSKVPCDRHMPESVYTIHAIAPSVSLPRRLQHRSKSSTHIFYPSQGRNANACTIIGARIHPPLRASAGASAASSARERHLRLLPRSRRSLACLIF